MATKKKEQKIEGDGTGNALPEITEETVNVVQESKDVQEEKVDNVEYPGGVIGEPVDPISIVDLKIPCNNRECKHTFKTAEDKEYAVKVGCPKCGT